MYQIKNPVAFHSVDMAILNEKNVLLAQKVKDAEAGDNLWRFPGGFIDVWDSCAEEAALREAMEETGLRFGVDFISKYFEQYFDKKKPLVKNLSELIKLSCDGIDGTGESIRSTIEHLQLITPSEAALAWIRGNISYIGSTKIDDVRYRDCDHKIITSFYEINCLVSGDVGEGPFDDIARTKWFSFSEITESIMHPAHKPLFKMLLDKYGKQ